MISPDTSPEAERVWLDAIRRLTPGERIVRALALSDALRSAALDMLQRQHPEWNVAECRAYLRRRWFGVG